MPKFVLVRDSVFFGTEINQLLKINAITISRAAFSNSDGRHYSLHWLGFRTVVRCSAISGENIEYI